MLLFNTDYCTDICIHKLDNKCMLFENDKINKFKKYLYVNYTSIGWGIFINIERKYLKLFIFLAIGIWYT